MGMDAGFSSARHNAQTESLDGESGLHYFHRHYITLHHIAIIIRSLLFKKLRNSDNEGLQSRTV